MPSRVSFRDCALAMWLSFSLLPAPRRFGNKVRGRLNVKLGEAVLVTASSWDSEWARPRAPLRMAYIDLLYFMGIWGYVIWLAALQG